MDPDEAVKDFENRIELYSKVPRGKRCRVGKVFSSFRYSSPLGLLDRYSILSLAHHLRGNAHVLGI